MNVQARGWCFTLFDYETKYDLVLKYLSDSTYYIIGKEICPDTKRPHLQGYVYYKKKIRFGALQKKLFNAHIEKAKGSPNDNTTYCGKDENYVEFGTKPEQGKRTDLIKLKNDIVDKKITVRDIIMDNPIAYHQYGRTLEKIEQINNEKIFRTEMTTCDWIYGPTGVGKSHMAFNNYHPDTHYIYPDNNGWWDNYNGQHTVIINDFRGSIKYNELLQLIDKWPYSVKRRNKAPAPFISKHIIITSSQKPSEVYKHLAITDSLDQLKRRINLVLLSETRDRSDPQGNTKPVDLETTSYIDNIN